MTKTFNAMAVLLFALSLTACATSSQPWVESYDSNQFEMKTVNDGLGSNYVVVSNNAAKWQGAYAGGEEMVQYRKELMKYMGEKHLVSVCAANGYQLLDEPSYSMQEQSGMAYGGGLLGELIAEAVSSYENIPSEMRVEYKCN